MAEATRLLDTSNDMEGGGADTSVLVPLRLLWRGISPKELRNRDQKRILDAVVLPFFFLWYLLLAYSATAPAALDGADPRATYSGGGGLVVRLLLALWAMYPLAIQVWCFPPPSEGTDAFMVQTYVGRWIYLTRHCLTFQAVHQVASLAAPLSATLSAMTHGVSLWIAALGWFVTVQYLVLVAPSAAFQQDVDMWARRGVQFKEVGLLIHVFALPIAVCDLTLVKSASELSRAVMVSRTVILCVSYCLFYVLMMICNFKVTGHWPYGFMKEFGHDIAKWTMFVLKQNVIFLVFTTVNWLILFARAR